MCAGFWHPASQLVVKLAFSILVSVKFFFTFFPISKFYQFFLLLLVFSSEWPAPALAFYSPVGWPIREQKKLDSLCNEKLCKGGHFSTLFIQCDFFIFQFSPPPPGSSAARSNEPVKSLVRSRPSTFSSVYFFPEQKTRAPTDKKLNVKQRTNVMGSRLGFNADRNLNL